MKYVLLSTVVVPSFMTQRLNVLELTKDEFLKKLKYVEVNYCGHPITLGVLKEHVPSLPDPVKGQFWNGEGRALAARPKGGVRAANQSGDTEVLIDDLEFCEFEVEGL